MIRQIQYFLELRKFRALSKNSTSAIPFGKPYPCMDDRRMDSGSASGHYFHQDLWIAQKIHENNPKTHIDIGSRVDGFVAHVAAFREIQVLDVRPLKVTIPNIRFRQMDLMKPDPEMAASADSVSCLHAIEHFGLGRYGDPMDPDGHLKGLSAITNLLRPGGTLYLSVPLGPLRVEFNAHRVFSMPYLMDWIRPWYAVKDFGYVDDKGDIHRHVPVNHPDAAASFGCRYGCAIFELVKTKSPVQG